MRSPESSWWVRTQDRWSTLLGCAPENRAAIVEAMMRAGPSQAAGYWLQLGLAVGIATMGLVLDSSAVVIGAMLVAPLMGPIIALGLGLAIGSPYLVLRSAVRVVLSLVVSTGASALIVTTLPFQTLTPEIAARTAPTALDLVTAAFCALAGVYAVMRPSSDMTTTAAGTSIGISLVPPLCASGYGVGVWQGSVAGGAALLFVTNMVAIVVVATLAFALFGFTRVDVGGLELAALADDAPTSPIPRAARKLARRFSSRGGLGLRLAMPVVLLALVYFPLRAALDEVTWQIRVRAALEAKIAELDEEVLESNLHVERHTVELALVLIGTADDAERLRQALDEEARVLSAVAPRIAVYAVPDASEFAGLVDQMHELPPIPPPMPPEPPAPPPEPTAYEHLEATLAAVDAAVGRHWPTSPLGPVLSVAMRSAAEHHVLVLVHHGSAIDPTARVLLERALSDDLGFDLVVETHSIPSTPVVADTDAAFITALASAIELARPMEGVWLCVQSPPAPERRRGREEGEEHRALVQAAIAGFPRLVQTEADSWRVQFARDGCEALK